MLKEGRDAVKVFEDECQRHPPAVLFMDHVTGGEAVGSAFLLPIVEPLASGEPLVPQELGEGFADVVVDAGKPLIS